MESDNMRQYYFLLILLIPTLFACASTHPKIQIANSIMNDFCNEMKIKNNFVMTGIGQCNSPPDNLRALSISFLSEEKLNLDQARKLFICTCEEFLSAVNSDEHVRPWLSNYPFTGQNLEVMLSFKLKNGLRIGPPFVTFVFVSQGMIYYSTYQNEQFIDIHKESYEEALKIIK